MLNKLLAAPKFSRALRKSHAVERTGLAKSNFCQILSAYFKKASALGIGNIGITDMFQESHICPHSYKIVEPICTAKSTSSGENFMDNLRSQGSRRLPPLEELKSASVVNVPFTPMPNAKFV